MVAESQTALHLAIALASEGWGLNPVPSLWDTKSGHFFPSSSRHWVFGHPVLGNHPL